MVCFSLICSHVWCLHSLSRAVSKCHGHRMINCIFYANWHPELKAAGGLIRVVSGVLHDPDLVFLFYCIPLSTDRPHSDYFGREGQPGCLQDLPKGKMKAMDSIKKLVNCNIMVNIAGYTFYIYLYFQGYKPPDEGPSEYQTIPLNKIEDFGVHCKQWVCLKILLWSISFWNCSMPLIQMITFLGGWLPFLSGCCKEIEGNYCLGVWQRKWVKMASVVLIHRSSAVPYVTIHFTLSSLAARLSGCQKATGDRY